MRADRHTSDENEIDDYVRRAMPISDDAVARLVDPGTRQALLDRILSLPTVDGTVPAHGGRRRHRLVLATATAGVVIAAGVGTVVTLDLFSPAGERPPPAAPSGTGSVAIGGGTEMMCAEVYGPDTVTARTFAFAGTVVEIAEPGPPDEGGVAYAQVTFQVEEWFRGGGADRFTISMSPPGQLTSVDTATYQVGSRLLVSGEDLWGSASLDTPVAWPCGFTRTHSASMAEEWRQAFAAG
jgi:hypothetical protein